MGTDVAYIAKYAQRMQANIAAVYRRADEIVVPSMHEAVCAHFERMTNLSTYFNERIDMTLSLDVEGRQGGQVARGLWAQAPGRPGGPTERPISIAIDKSTCSRRRRLRMRRARQYNEALARDHPEIFVQIEPAVWQKPWLAHAQAAGRGPTALRYLAAYVKKSAFSEGRLLGYDQTGIPPRAAPVVGAAPRLLLREPPPDQLPRTGANPCPAPPDQAAQFAPYPTEITFEL